MRRVSLLTAISAALFSLPGFAQADGGIRRGPLGEYGPGDDLAIVSYHVEERIATIYGPHITTYNVSDTKYISTNDLGPGNLRRITPKFAKVRKKEAVIALAPAVAVSLPIVPSTSQELRQTVVMKAPERKAGYAYINILKTYERILAKGYKSVDMLRKVADQRFFDGDLEIAAGWYTKLFELTDDLEEIYYYRYAASLKAIRENKKADELMAVFESKRAQSKTGKG